MSKAKRWLMLTGIAGIALILVGSFSKGQEILIEPEGKTEKRVSTKDRIAFIPIKKDQGLPIPPGKFEARFKEEGKKAGVVVFECKKDFLSSGITIKPADGSMSRIQGVPTCFTSEAGTVDLAGMDSEDVFFVVESGGTRGHSIGLNFINPQKSEIVGL